MEYSITPDFIVPLWEDAAPLAKGSQVEDRPSMKVYIPKGSSQPMSAMVIYPGGGYNHHANHEGDGYAEWFLSLGMVSIVVNYRLGSNGYRHPAMLTDAARAVRLARYRANDFHLDPNHVAVIGSSAGGHLVGMLATCPTAPFLEPLDPVDGRSSMPNAAILCYPVISMQVNPHSGSRQFLAGETPSPEFLQEISPDQRVFSKTPPCFIWHTTEDQRVSVNHSLLFASALQHQGIPFELHIYQKGVHGIGLANGHPWTVECRRWLGEYSFISTGQ